MIRPSFQSKPLENEVFYQQFISKIQIQVLHRYRGFSFFIQHLVKAVWRTNLIQSILLTK